MAPDHASRDRIAALGSSSRARPAAGGVAPDASGAPAPDPGSAPREHPDPEFWGAEPRRVRTSPRAGPRPQGGPPAWAGWIDRVRDGRLEIGIGVVVLALVALVAGVVWYRMGAAGGAPPPAHRSGASAPTSGSAGGPGGGSGAARRSTTATPYPTATPPAGAVPVTVTTTAAAAAHRGPTVVVHVAGAVVRPGVLLMPEGARVIDAVEGAGGATPDADLDRLNLAARLVDGQRILVAKVGETAAAAPGGVADSAGDAGALIDLNSATVAQLDTLPGIGPTLAGAIIAERERRGGFRSINELREVRGIGEARFADLRERVTV